MKVLHKINHIKASVDPYSDISGLLKILHLEGPASSDILESLALYKVFHSESFKELEERIIIAIGLFYKVKEPTSLYSFLMASVGIQHKLEYGALLTPVQASVRRAINDNQYVSISAPTSAGKSYSIRDFIAEQKGDAVIVVPSRALIAEYVASIRDRFAGDKTVMISTFVDTVFTSRNLRRIFILTPERARELFVIGPKLDVAVFFFDEAQVSEDASRGVIFDVLVRRVNKIFPSAKLIFAHPFVDNPEAQFTKHNLPSSAAYARPYTHGSVGKISVFRHGNGGDYYFSPFEEKGHILTKCAEFEGGFEGFAFSGNHSILVYVSKSSIYSGRFTEGFDAYISSLENISEQRALNIISAVEHMLGADISGHNSKLVALLRKGVVIHHGSVPLEVRFLIEDFIRGRYAKLCFATSTLAQGVNMPFDIVWLQTMRISGESSEDRSLAFKNLIGRAGRLTDEQKFDYGYVFTENAKLYAQRLNDSYRLSEVSIIDSDGFDANEDTQEVMDAFRSNTFNEDFNLPEKKIDRLSAPAVLAACQTVLDIMYSGSGEKQDISGEALQPLRIKVRESLKLIFEASINRKLLDGEVAVFRTAIVIFLLATGGWSFREIAGIRYSDISKRNERRVGVAEFAQAAAKLPDASLKKPYPLVKGVLAKDVSYDAVVFDTYDYMDQVISFSLVDVFSAAFKIYVSRTADDRANKMIELLRYGTNNVIHMLLMRYGFPPEAVGEVSGYIKFINEREIIFNDGVNDAPAHVKSLVSWYLP
ncbi:DEAD/DEAH box helicase [Pseudomonas asiatica]|uniref:DEAD/DEAH box helicase n=1 Tax=Pseudomonas asiatica TaxID=2219225 RepID=UPI0032EF8AC4